MRSKNGFLPSRALSPLSFNYFVWLGGCVRLACLQACRLAAWRAVYSSIHPSIRSFIPSPEQGEKPGKAAISHRRGFAVGKRKTKGRFVVLLMEIKSSWVGYGEAGWARRWMDPFALTHTRIPACLRVDIYRCIHSFIQLRSIQLNAPRVGECPDGEGRKNRQRCGIRDRICDCSGLALPGS